jgi:hypothetical protein
MFAALPTLPPRSPAVQGLSVLAIVFAVFVAVMEDQGKGFG